MCYVFGYVSVCELALSVAMFMARFIIIVLAMFWIGYGECCILD